MERGPYFDRNRSSVSHHTGIFAAGHQSDANKGNEGVIDLNVFNAGYRNRLVGDSWLYPE